MPTVAPQQELGEVAWKGAGKKFLDSLLEGSLADLSQSFPELVIVPDGLLWYLPFEALEIQAGRCAGAADFARPHSLRPHRLIGDCRRPAARGPPDLGGAGPAVSPSTTTEQARRSRPSARPCPTAWRCPGPTRTAPANAYAALVDRLVVLDDLGAAEAIPMAGPPSPWITANREARWPIGSRFPGTDRRVVVLPGFHTAAESGLKHVEHKAPGNGLFLSVCA